MYRAGIYTSVVNTNSQVGSDLLLKIQKNGRGEYYFIRSPEEVKDVVSTDIADDMTETVIDGKDTPVIIEDYNDPLVEGITQLPNITGYYYGKVKSNATVVLSVDYKKPSGGVVSVPIYSYWTYGNGKVTSISTTYSGISFSVATVTVVVTILRIVYVLNITLSATSKSSFSSSSKFTRQW